MNRVDLANGTIVEEGGRPHFIFAVAHNDGYEMARGSMHLLYKSNFVLIFRYKTLSFEVIKNRIGIINSELLDYIYDTLNLELFPKDVNYDHELHFKHESDKLIYKLRYAK